MEQIVQNNLEEVKDSSPEMNPKKKYVKSQSKDEIEFDTHKAQPMKLAMLKKKSSIIRKGSGDEDIMKEIGMEMKIKQRISRALEVTQSERDEGERELSPHVVTRYFRAPEIILMDKNYNQKVDIWACGAIF